MPTSAADALRSVKQAIFPERDQPYKHPPLADGAFEVGAVRLRRDETINVRGQEIGYLAFSEKLNAYTPTVVKDARVSYDPALRLLRLDVPPLGKHPPVVQLVPVEVLRCFSPL